MLQGFGGDVATAALLRQWERKGNANREGDAIRARRQRLQHQRAATASLCAGRPIISGPPQEEDNLSLRLPRPPLRRPPGAPRGARGIPQPAKPYRTLGGGAQAPAAAQPQRHGAAALRQQRLRGIVPAKESYGYGISMPFNELSPAGHAAHRPHAAPPASAHEAWAVPSPPQLPRGGSAHDRGAPGNAAPRARPGTAAPAGQLPELVPRPPPPRRL
eukprot:TRINITY_DN50252_c0_g1_i1.p2 TRINITY_DN50252_c0_g1~~TRINITY_DN50252_c0_g1_i1.p2  ORF type:complete len:217 (+),score=45.40 TRINITY_DN50252_c0_g1_i1:87-737(+)